MALVASDLDDPTLAGPADIPDAQARNRVAVAYGKSVPLVLGLRAFSPARHPFPPIHKSQFTIHNCPHAFFAPTMESPRRRASRGMLRRRGAAPGRVAVRPGEIEFTASVNAKAFDSGWIMPGYHAVVWKGGRMAHAALLQADVSDSQILDALKTLGAKPGDNLPMEVWEERKNSKDPAADKVIAGSVIEVLLRLPSRADLVPLASVLEDSGGRGLDMRFGGNAANIPRWKSGCVVCLYSCPGSKVGQRALHGAGLHEGDDPVSREARDTAYGRDKGRRRPPARIPFLAAGNVGSDSGEKPAPEPPSFPCVGTRRPAATVRTGQQGPSQSHCGAGCGVPCSSPSPPTPRNAAGSGALSPAQVEVKGRRVAPDGDLARGQPENSTALGLNSLDRLPTPRVSEPLSKPTATGPADPDSCDSNSVVTGN